MSNLERIRELAALRACGALDGADAEEFDLLLADPTSGAQTELAACSDALMLAASSSLAVTPPSALRERLLAALPAQGAKVVPSPVSTPELSPFVFLKNSGDTGWQPLPVQGAYVKLLHMDSERGYAVVLGKLDPGTHYPAHTHHGPEQIYVLTGDLCIEGNVLGPGDFHHAGAFTSHGVNSSRTGCTILVVLTTADLQAQWALA